MLTTINPRIQINQKNRRKRRAHGGSSFFVTGLGEQDGAHQGFLAGLAQSGLTVTEQISTLDT